MSLATLVWQEIRARPTAMLTGLLTIMLGTAALVAIRNITFYSEAAVARELEALGANVLLAPTTTNPTTFVQGVLIDG